MPEPLVAPLGTAIQDYLQTQRLSMAAQLRPKVTGGDLSQALQRSTSASALRDNQSFRSIGGQKIVRTNGGCAQIQTVQGSSSPTNRIDIAEPTGCPGGSPDPSQEMGKALQDWADKHQAPP